MPRSDVMSIAATSAKARKLAKIARYPAARRALARHRVAAATEHLEAIRRCDPATLLDVGANKGQFSLAVRSLLPGAGIHAFEPLPAAAATYASVFRDDDRAWLHRVAIGAERATATFYVTDRQDSSSLLRPGTGQREAFGVTTASEIDVTVVPLEDEVDLDALPKPIMMKIDVQGAELEVLRGSARLDLVDHVYVELSYVELYEGQPLFDDVRAHLDARGYELLEIYNEVRTPRFGLTQADCLFVRREAGGES